MKSSFLISIFLCLVFVIEPIAGLAFETDQFNLPPAPLADIGDEVDEYVAGELRSVVAATNAEISKRRLCISVTSEHVYGCGPVGLENDRLTYLMSNDAIARGLYDKISGDSLMFTKIGSWMKSHKFRAAPATYKASYGESIFVALPTNYLTISPTVRLYGVEFGVDKIEHLFQQGYKYYKQQNEAIAKGTASDAAAKKAVAWGQKTERTYYGLFVSGVYSNADLVANYAGLKFYRRLTGPVTIGDKTYAPLVVLNGGQWQINETAISTALLRPYITEHLNEALNPSGYAFNLIGSVRHSVKKYGCPEWKKAYPELTADSLKTRSKSLELWYGEDYGFAEKGKMVRLAETCF